jgi:hypothetical protein
MAIEEARNPGAGKPSRLRIERGLRRTPGEKARGALAQPSYCEGRLLALGVPSPAVIGTVP